jgi:hypothetical protein
MNCSLKEEYYPFAMEDGGRLAPMAAVLVDRMAILVVVRRFLGMGVAHSRSLRYDNYVRMQHFVRRSTSVPFRRFWGQVRCEFMQRLSTAFHGTRGFYLRDAFKEGNVDTVELPSCSSGLGFFLVSSFWLVASTAFSCKNFLSLTEELEETTDQKGKNKKEKSPHASAREIGKHATASAIPSCKASRRWEPKVQG